MLVINTSNMTDKRLPENFKIGPYGSNTLYFHYPHNMM